MKSLFDFMKKHILVFTIGALLLILVLIFMAVSFIVNYSATLDILVVPTDAMVMINGEQYENGIYENMHIGKTHVSISLEGFDSQDFEIELKRGEKTRLYTYLDTDSDWYQNIDDNTQYLIDIINEYKGELETKELMDKYPVMKDIPIVVEEYFNNYTQYVYYRIDGGIYEECEQEFCLKITDISGGNYDRALQTLREKGYNPDDYDIIYDDTNKKGHA